jgi:hypothetical protein
MIEIKWRKLTHGREGGDGVLEVGTVKVFLGIVNGHTTLDIRCILAFVT